MINVVKLNNLQFNGLRTRKEKNCGGIYISLCNYLTPKLRFFCAALHHPEPEETTTKRELVANSKQQRGDCESVVEFRGGSKYILRRRERPKRSELTRNLIHFNKTFYPLTIRGI